eukprot:2964879-Rhodomonas_salina.2
MARCDDDNDPNDGASGRQRSCSKTCSTVHRRSSLSTSLTGLRPTTSIAHLLVLETWLRMLRRCCADCSSSACMASSSSSMAPMSGLRAR